jgi:hypothetical protein
MKKLNFVLISALIACFSSCRQPSSPSPVLGNTTSRQVSTFAGSGNIGSTNATGTAASFNYPVGTAVDGSGNIYVADSKNNSIRQITSSGVVTTLLGSGIAGYGDTLSYMALFNMPTDVALDASNNFYIADSENHVIRITSKIANPIPYNIYVGTLAGSGTAGYVDGIFTEASFNTPTSIAVVNNSGSIYVYVADYGNNVIRKIVYTAGSWWTTATVTTLAGSGTVGSSDGTGTTASFNKPYGVAVDAVGNVYVGDRGNHLIRKITPVGVVTTLAGSGTAGFTDGTGTAASFNNPCHLTVDANGNVYVADYGNNAIREITPAGVVTTVAGTGTIGSTNGAALSATFYNPTGIAIDASGNLYIADGSNQLIRKITP